MQSPDSSQRLQHSATSLLATLTNNKDSGTPLSDRNKVEILQYPTSWVSGDTARIEDSIVPEIDDIRTKLLQHSQTWLSADLIDT